MLITAIVIAWIVGLAGLFGGVAWLDQTDSNLAAAAMILGIISCLGASVLTIIRNPRIPT